MTQPLAVSAFSTAYVEREDRIAVVVTSPDGERLALMLTRRLAGRLVNGLAGLLERTSSIAHHLPEDARGAVILFEHQGAVTQPKESSVEQAAPSIESRDERVPMLLLTDVGVTTHPDRFRVTLRHADHALAAFDCGRSDLHRLIAIIQSTCDQVGWRVPIQATWLHPDADGALTVN